MFEKNRPLAPHSISVIIAHILQSSFGKVMPKFKLILLSTTLTVLFGCTAPKPTPQPQIGYLKNNISQSELNNVANFKRYNYYCYNFETASSSFLASYFPLWKESRFAENFGFYFQLDNGKALPFDHLENKVLNSTSSRFEVRYRSYLPIDGDYVELKAREKSSIYYKNNQPWLECFEG